MTLPTGWFTIISLRSSCLCELSLFMYNASFDNILYIIAEQVEEDNRKSYDKLLEIKKEIRYNAVGGAENSAAPKYALYPGCPERQQEV